jgi:hypothetical protein
MINSLDLAAYLPEVVNNTERADLLLGLTLDLIYDVVPPALADPSPRVKVIALEVAARAYRNADGYAVERVDDYSYQRPATTQEAGVYLTDSERAILTAIAVGKTPRRVRSVRMGSWSVPYR